MKRIFNPKTIALVGATQRKGSVGVSLAKNLLKGNQKVFFVNPNKVKVLNKKTYGNILDIKEKVDLVVIAVGAKIVSKVADDCIQKKVGGIIIISAGFAERGKEGKKMQEEIVSKTKKAGIPLIGPNCLGIIIPWNNLNASFAPINPKKGGIAFLSQSGAILDAMLDKSLLDGFGFSAAVSYGNQADVCLADLLKYFDKDKKTKVISVYLEGIKEGRDFLSAAKSVSKPIVLIKAGKTEKGKKAATSHTAALSGDYQIYKTAFKQSGIVEVDSLEELFDVSTALCFYPKCANSIGIITNGGGCGVLAADYSQRYGLNLASISKDTIKRLQKFMPSFIPSNPLDIFGDALSKRYEQSVEAMLLQKNIYGLIVIESLQMMTEPVKNAKIIARLQKKFPCKPIVCCFMGGKINSEANIVFQKNRIANFSDPKRAVKAMEAIVK